MSFIDFFRCCGLLIVGLLIAPFFRNELLIFLVLLLFLVVSLFLHYERNEWLLIVLGLALGSLMELGGDSVYKLQYWVEGSFFGIPVWLPLMWGYLFLLIRRLGNLVVKSF